MKTYVLYHDNCPDGTGAALVAFLTFGKDAEYIPVSYGKPPPVIEFGSQVFILDFSYPRAVLEDLRCNRCDQLVVLDHHATAKAELEGLPGCHFNMDKSGAVLAWEYFFPYEPVPMFFQFLQDRDLWRFALPGSREISAVIGSFPFTIESFHTIYLETINGKDGLFNLLTEGRACLRLKEQQVNNMAKHHRWAYLDTKNRKITFTEKLEPGGNGDPMIPDHVAIMPVANATVFFSEVGEMLLKLNPSVDCAAYYFDRSDGKQQWGLRSRPSFNCSLVAKAFGGGGHPQAAGFILSGPATAQVEGGEK